MPHSSYHERVAQLCGRAARVLESMADDWSDLGDAARAKLASDVSEQLAKLAFDALMDTQPIEITDELRAKAQAKD